METLLQKQARNTITAQAANGHTDAFLPFALLSIAQQITTLVDTTNNFIKEVKREGRLGRKS